LLTISPATAFTHSFSVHIAFSFLLFLAGGHTLLQCEWSKDVWMTVMQKLFTPLGQHIKDKWLVMPLPL
jgi:hypothetical protein